MSEVRGRRPDRATIIATAALVVAIAALVAAVGGIAGAAPGKTVVRKVVAVRKGLVHRGEIAPGAVTNKTLAHGAVSANKIRKEAITAPKLAKASVGPETIAADAVTAGAIAPGSVYGGALGQETVVTKPIADIDKDPHNGEWTPSNGESALCGEGEALMGTGFSSPNPNNGQALWLEALPVANGSTKGVVGRIESDSGGTANGVVAAVCLK
jgi:hypothetical protein